MKNCIACGAIVPLYSRYCSRCGVYLPEILFGKEQAEEEKQKPVFGSSALPPLVIKLMDEALITSQEVLAVEEKYWKELYTNDH